MSTVRQAAIEIAEWANDNGVLITDNVIDKIEEIIMRNLSVKMPSISPEEYYRG